MSVKFEVVPDLCKDELIRMAMESSRGFYDMESADRFFGMMCDEHPGFTSPARNVYRYRDYFINVGKRIFMAGHGDCLMQLNRFGLSCLPEGIGQVWLENNEDMVLFTRIEGSSGRRLLPLEKGARLTEEAGKLLLSDVERLLENNYALTAISESRDSWYLLEGEGRVVLSDSRLAFAPDAARNAYLARVKSILGF